MFVVRMVIGIVLFVSGFEKVVAPFQNFLYAIQAYQVLPGPLEVLAAQVFPWLEMLTGLYLMLGLLTALMLKWAMMIFASFIMIVGQALLRGLPIENCGCFGELIHIAPRWIIIMDSFLLLSLVMCLRFLAQTKRFSLDNKLT